MVDLDAEFDIEKNKNKIYKFDDLIKILKLYYKSIIFNLFISNNQMFNIFIIFLLVFNF